MTKDKIETILEDGRTVMAQAPVIISASRSTDIPAFYADWFFHRLQIGYSAWTNPFTGVKSYINYRQTRFIIFWSKDPTPLLPYLKILREKNIGCYVQYTLNDYEKENLEKRVPALERRIDTFKRLVDELGLGGVIWRFDPLLLTETVGINELLAKIEYIGDKLHGYTEKLVFSYADITEYRKVKANLDRQQIPYRIWDEKEMNQMASALSTLNKKWNYQLATCAENIALEHYDIMHNRCIDTDLIVRRAYNDATLMKFLQVNICTQGLFDATLPTGAIALSNGHYFFSRHKKDGGQRTFCQCAIAKDIGEYNTCPHQCEYCYANTNKDIAWSNYEQHLRKPFCETISGK